MAGLVAVGLVAGTSLLVASPASAAPGDAEALGASAVIDVDLPIIGFTADASVGSVAVTGGGSDSSSETDYALVDLLLADVNLGAVETAASSDAAGSEASSQIADADASLLGIDLLSLDAASVEVTCPTGGTPTADVDVAGLELLGDAATVTAGDVGVSATTALGADVGGVDLTGLELTVTVTQVETADATGAAGIALLAVVTLDGTLGATVFDSDVVATLTLAAASCAPPLVVPVTATAITPAVGPTSGGQTVTITGSGFTPATTVVFGADPATGAPATGIVVNADGTSLTAVTPAGAAGPTTVTVANPGSSAGLAYTYVAPSVTSLTPDSGPSAGGTTVTITGQTLGGTTGVTFGGAPGTIVGTPTDTEVVVTTPAGAVGAVDVVIQLPGDDIVIDDGFTYTDDAPLTAVALTPDAGPTAGGQTVTITGTGFTDETTVTFGTAPGTSVAVNADGTSLTVTTPPGTAGPTVVTVANPGDTATLDYTYLAPTVSGISPAAGPSAGGTTVVITGTGLGGATDVLFDGTPGTIVGTPSDTQVVVVTPPGAAGPADVVIVLPGDDAVVTGGYVYLPAPIATGVDPGQGPAGGGTTVIVDGGGFVPGATTVTICGVTIPATQIAVNADGTRLRFTTPPCAVGGAQIVVSTPGGSTDPLGFRYTATTVAGTGGSGSGSLASTGFDPVPVVGAGLGLALLGLLTAFGARARRRSA